MSSRLLLLTRVGVPEKARFKISGKRAPRSFSPRFGYSPNLEARFARVPLELENSGISYFRVAPNFRIRFGHKHRQQEEIYVLMFGSARMKLDDEMVELKPWDAIRVPAETMPGLEVGPLTGLST
jgi:mannose-6-phosphate isomerase-like protein (cupin superfamily)